MIRRSLLFSALFAAGGVAAAWLSWDTLPASMPIHWGPAGRPDGFAARETAVLLAPGISLLVPLLVLAITRLDPRREHVDRSEGALAATLVGISAFGFGLQVLTLRAAQASDMGLEVGGLAAMMGMLFLAIGNALPKAKSNWFFGVRTPWTLSSERVWHLTHRMAGWSFALAGLGLLASGLLVPRALMLWAVLPLTLLGSLAPAVYSYLAFCRLEEPGPVGTAGSASDP